MRKILLTYAAGITALAAGAGFMFPPAGLIVAGTGMLFAALWILDDGES